MRLMLCQVSPHVRSAATIAVAITLLALLPSAPALAQDRGVGGTSSAASAEGKGARVALVMGNAAYANGPLQNPVNDATDIAGALKQCGFTVSLKTDCDLRTMKAALDEFGSRIPPDGVALFFYAGHGMQVNGRNYLVPIGAEPKGAADVEFECLDSGRVLGKLEDGSAQLNIIILDACRNNPLSRSWSRAVPQGLASMEAPTGSILLYATAPGKVASDGKGRNGLYTGSLLKYLATPNLDVVDVFRKTGDEVRRATSDGQVPWLSLSFTGTFSFVSKGESTAPSTTSSLPAAPPAMKLVGGLQVSVNAPNAKVKVDGKEVGSANPEAAFELKNVPAGSVLLEVHAEGFESVSQQVQIKEGDWTQVPVKLSKVMVVKPEEPKRPPTVSVGGEAKAGDVRVFAGGEFAWIPAGSFEMGDKLSAPRIASTYGGQEKNYQDAPRHTVTLTKGFWLGVHEVTNGEFEAFEKATGHKTDAETAGTGFMFNTTSGQFEDKSGASWRNPGWKAESKLPVVLVSWNDAQAYVGWMNGKGDGTYRLPTEAEWEYACRAGTTTEFFWGDLADKGKGYLNAMDETKASNGKTRGEGGFPFSDGYYLVAPVGSFKANPWGLYDMHGNVFEWCADWYGDYPSGSVKDPSGPGTGEYRVLRGGSWGNLPGRCRAAYRFYHMAPDNRIAFLGFRLLRTQDS